jgi:putative SOS response-associated peptidase YedK
MCGRFTRLYSWKQLYELMGLTTPSQDPFAAPAYNVAPTDLSPVVRAAPSGREAAVMRWGLVPSWATDVSIGNRCINARSEEAATKPAFRAAMKSRRCLVPISGFYEWQQIGGRHKQPWYFTPADGTIFAVAGLWESWGPENLQTFTVLTGEPNDLVRKVHNRMPCILPQEHWSAWLDPASNPPPLQVFHAEGMIGHPVSPKVSSVKNDSPDLIREVAPEGLW